jgi:hypothetical protein
LNSQLSKRPYSRELPLRAAAICGLLAPITFVAGWLLGGLAQPDAYSVVDHDISDLGALTADEPWLYHQLGANLTGLLLCALALGLWKAVGTSLAARLGLKSVLLKGHFRTLAYAAVPAFAGEGRERIEAVRASQ